LESSSMKNFLKISFVVSLIVAVMFAQFCDKASWCSAVFFVSVGLVHVIGVCFLTRRLFDGMTEVIVRVGAIVFGVLFTLNGVIGLSDGLFRSIPSGEQILKGCSSVCAGFKDLTLTCWSRDLGILSRTQVDKQYWIIVAVIIFSGIELVWLAALKLIETPSLRKERRK
jgi:hypothetical protein